ncbi:MAG: hypothetical protein PHN60_03765 [Candidatus Gracilibacteria bacterium]|nr:hypothetical protein [Candidatus Gracilibacteria bacterium]
MSVQALSSFDDLSTREGANAHISVTLSERSIDIPMSVLKEFKQLFLYGWQTEEQFLFSRKTRDYFQSIQPLSSEEIKRIAVSICGVTFRERTFIERGHNWERMEMDAKEENGWIFCIEDSLRNRMYPTASEKVAAFFSLQFERLLKTYEA